MSRRQYTVEHCAIVVLAAGMSSRLGSPKQLLVYQGKSLLLHAVDIALQTTIRPVVVVIGANNDVVKREMEGIEVDVVDNKEWQEGMASSLRCGLVAVQKINGGGVGHKPCEKEIVFAGNVHLLLLQAGVYQLMYCWVVHIGLTHLLPSPKEGSGAFYL